MRILIVDDEPSLLDHLKRTFESERYMVETAGNGDAALDKIFEAPFDLIILDIMLPVRDGLSVLQEIRQARIGTPVLMLTARSEINDRVKGLDQGADDYLAKPFSMAELMARARALLRRASEHPSPVLKIGGVQIDTISREVTADGVPVQLTPKEFSILEFLLYNKNRVVSRFNLAEHVWGEEFDPFSMTNLMNVHVKNLRNKIGDTDGNIIRTVRGLGYIIREEE